MRYFIELCYDGTTFHGWQMQEGASSVQEVLQSGLKYKMGLTEKVTGCGRTDAGVHATQFFAHFDHSRLFEPDQLASISHELNRYLPKSIAIYRIFRVSENAHARFDASSRTYKYYINQTKNPFSENFAWTHPYNFDLKKMNEAAAIMMNYTDFTSFSKLHTDVKTNNCIISEAFWKQLGGQLIFTISANRFLRNMVRAIVGTLVQVGRGKINIDDIHKIILSKNRGNAGMSVPARGLFLEKITYNREQICQGTRTETREMDELP